MNKNRIYVFNTHYEIYDYHIGDFPELEYDLTHYNGITHKKTPKYFFDYVRKILYVPRGYDDAKLMRWNKKFLSDADVCNPVIPAYFSMVLPPKNKNQELAIDYLTGNGVYKSTKNVTQKVLIMPPSSGKTYCAVHAIQVLQMRAMVIVRTKNLKEQWMERLLSYTNLDKSRVIDIDSSDLLEKYMKVPPNPECAVFITTRSLLHSFCNLNGCYALNEAFSALGIGLKIVDEVHQEYERTLFIDYMTNVAMTFYLTATFAQSEKNNNIVFQNAFNLTQKLQIENNYRHIIYIAVIYDSHPDALIREKLFLNKKFDRFSYIDYQLDQGFLQGAMKYCMNYYLNEKGEKGKTLILSSKHSSCDYFEKLANRLVGDTHTVCSFYTGNKVENYKSYDVICATPQMLGTGEDIPQLRFLFNTEPGRSLPNTYQFSGRLRPYKDENGEANTIYVEFVDKGFSKLYQWYKTRKNLMDRNALKCYELPYKED